MTRRRMVWNGREYAHRYVSVFKETANEGTTTAGNGVHRGTNLDEHSANGRPARLDEVLFSSAGLTRAFWVGAVIVGLILGGIIWQTFSAGEWHEGFGTAIHAE